MLKQSEVDREGDTYQKQHVHNFINLEIFVDPHLLAIVFGEGPGVDELTY